MKEPFRVKASPKTLEQILHYYGYTKPDQVNDLQAIVKEWLQQQPRKSVPYITTFATDEELQNIGWNDCLDELIRNLKG